MAKLKPGIDVVTRQGLHYVVEDGGGVKQARPWLGDCFSFLYDFSMRRSVFPRMLGADIHKHAEILGQVLADVHGKRVLELGTGSGSAVHFLSNDNLFTGTDVSPGLLGKAMKRFGSAGFEDAEFYAVSADDLPFDDGVFDACLCILSLNFFDDARAVVREARRVLSPGGVFVCSVPVPERNALRSTIRGKLYSESELRDMCQDHGFEFESLPGENGALLYFRARLT